MPHLNLRITVQNGKTVTRIGKAKDIETVTFSNEGQDTLTVTLDKDIFRTITGSPVGRIPGRAARRLAGVRGFTVAPGNQVSLTVIGSVPAGTEVNYTAQIGRSTREDPIIIIEK